MVGGVFLAWQEMCEDCPYRDMNIFLRENYCNKCIMRKKFDEQHRVIKWR